MRFFSAAQTEKLVASGPITERDIALYYSLGVMLACIVSQYSIWVGAPGLGQFLAESLLTLAMTAWGLYYWWESNGKSEGHSFLVRVVFLSLPVGLVTFIVNFILGWILVYFALELFGGGTFQSPERAYGVVAYSLSFGTYLWYWLWIGRVLKRLRNLREI